MLEKVPPESKVWTDEFLASHLSMRRYIKVLPEAPHNYRFESGLFMPDRVIISRRWLALAQPGVRDHILAFLTEKKFAVLFRDDDFVLLANPFVRGDGSEPASWIDPL